MVSGCIVEGLMTIVKLSSTSYFRIKLKTQIQSIPEAQFESIIPPQEEYLKPHCIMNISDSIL